MQIAWFDEQNMILLLRAKDIKIKYHFKDNIKTQSTSIYTQE